MVRSITPEGHAWVPVNTYSECPCGINRWDCTYHKPERKPIKVKKLTNEDVERIIREGLTLFYA